MGLWKRWNGTEWVTQNGAPLGAGGSPSMSTAEAAHWSDRAALLDPAAYEYVSGTSWTRTVPAGECWHALNMWHVRAASGTSFQFLRNADASAAVPLPAGTVLTADATQIGSAYLCKPALVTSSDSRYSADPKGLYYERLNRLRTLAQSELAATMSTGQAWGATATGTFPTDFSEGMVVMVSEHDISWLTLDTGSGGVNVYNEISDDHEQRIGAAALIPFQRATFPGIRIRAASVAGDASGFSSIAGEGIVRYVKLPADW